jgi:hypothetical protein
MNFGRRCINISRIILKHSVDRCFYKLHIAVDGIGDLAIERNTI